MKLPSISNLPTKKPMPNERGTFDFEAWEWVNPLCCGFAWGDIRNPSTHFIHDKTARSPDKLAESALLYMLEHESVDQWWAHNLGKYDGLFISAAAIRLGFKQTARLAGGNRVIELEVSSKGRRVTFRDSYAVVPSSLADAAVGFELPSRKLFTKDDYSKDVRTWNTNRLREGCITDCRLVLELLDKVETLFQGWGGELRRTFSSAALNVVKKRLAEDGKQIPNHFDNPDINPIARQAYYGARVEVLHHMPARRLVEYDVNSAYPAAMSQVVPWEYKKTHEGKSAQSVLDSDREGLVRAIVTVPNRLDIPPLPFKLSPDSGIYFPTGTWEGWFPACELRYAREECDVKAKCDTFIEYTSEKPFTKFIEEVYTLKSTAKGALRTFAKYVLNGCYGKFGEKPEHSTLIHFETEYEALKAIQENEGCYSLGGDSRSVALQYVRWAKHSHFGVASYITGRARTALHRYLVQSQKPAYCDTDSIHCEAWDGQSSNELGGLKLELNDYEGTFYAPKIYRLKPDTGREHLACKGFPVHREAFERMLESALDTLRHIPKQLRRKVQVDRMRLLKSQLRGTDNTPKTAVARITQFKHWAGLSMKRKPFDDGSTEPWTVNELREGKHTTAVSPAIKRMLTLTNTIRDIEASHAYQHPSHIR